MSTDDATWFRAGAAVGGVSAERVCGDLMVSDSRIPVVIARGRFLTAGIELGVVLITESPPGSVAGVQLGGPAESRKFREEISVAGAPNENFAGQPARGALVARRTRPA